MLRIRFIVALRGLMPVLCLLAIPPAKLCGSGLPVSDDFNDTALNTNLWTALAPAGGSVAVSNGHLNLIVPGGSNHDAFVGGSNSVRILQTITNTEFDVTAKFDSLPNAQYQGNGILVQQDWATYLRIECFSDGNDTNISAMLVSGGEEETFFQSPLSNAVAPMWLQVQRSGDNWMISYSTDSANYAGAGTFTQSLNVTAIGPYAWNYNDDPAQAPAFMSAVDYFYNVNGGSTGNNPPVISNVSAVPGDRSAVISWSTHEPSTTGVNYGFTTGYGSGVLTTGLVTTHSIALLDLACGATYDYQAASINAQGESSGSANSTFVTDPCSGGGGGGGVGGGPVSDNFDSLSLNTDLWTFVNPLNDGILSMNGTSATLNVPAGAPHDAWVDVNNSVRLMQSVSNTDFQVQARFQSDIEIGNQDEGILVQQDNADFLRFDILNNGDSTILFAAGVNGDNASVFTYSPVNVSQAPICLRLQRTGDNWAGSWSTDGVNFNIGVTFTYSMVVSSIGPYAATFNPDPSRAPAFTAIVDYFFNMASPLPNLDGPPPFPAITVEADPPYALVEKTLADIRGAGDLNPVAGFEAPSGGIYWYEYPASGNLTDPWLKHTIVSNGNAYEDMLPLDVNGDGAVDIVASYSPPSGENLIVWFENPAGHGGDPANDTWAMHVIGSGEGENNLVIGDLDGDGKPDIATGNSIYFQNTPDSWAQVQFNSAFRGVALLDIGSGNGSINLVSTSSAPYRAVWFENPRENGGNPRTDTWVMHDIGAGYSCTDESCPDGDDVAAYATGDVNGDGRMDVVMGQSEAPFAVMPPPGGLVWFEAPADPRNGTWIRHTIDLTFVDTHAIRIGDMEGMGRWIWSPRNRISLRYDGWPYSITTVRVISPNTSFRMPRATRLVSAMYAVREISIFSTLGTDITAIFTLSRYS